MDGRPVNEDDSVWKSKDVRGGQITDAVGSVLLLPKDVRAWQGNNTTQMIENLKHDSVVVSFVFCFLFFFFKLDGYFQPVQGVFEAGSWLIEIECLS